MSIRTAADTLAPRLPKTIRAVQARLAISPDLWGLPNSALRLAQILASYTPLDRLRVPIGFNREKPAEILQCSTRSIDRHLSVLVSFGLIERIRQRKLRGGGWDCTRVKWTEEAIKIFFKPMIVTVYSSAYAEPGVDQGNQPSSSNDSMKCCATNVARKTKASGKPSEVSIEKKSPQGIALAEQENQKQPLQAMQADEVNVAPVDALPFHSKVDQTPNESPKEQIQVGNVRVTAEEKRVHGDLSRLPGDLIEPAKQLGLKRSEMVYLMSICRTIDQRLQDVLALTLPDMMKRGLKGREAVGWMKAVIQSGRDFKWIVKRTKQEGRERVRKARRIQAIDRLAGIITDQQQMVLPNGATALESTYGMTVIRTLGGKVSTMPTKALAEACLRQSIGWSKMVFRGGISKPTQIHIQTQAGTSAAKPGAVAERSQAGRAELQKMLSVLKGNRKIQRSECVQ